MPEWLQSIQDFVVEHRGPILLWLTVGSVVTVLAAVFAMPLWIERLPVDYFTARRQQRQFANPALHATWWVVRNLLGVVLLLVGIVLLFLPGQGLLMMLVGLMLMDFPGKRGLERRIARRPQLWKALNWMRRKRGKPEFVRDDEPDSPADPPATQ